MTASSPPGSRDDYTRLLCTIEHEADEAGDKQNGEGQEVQTSQGFRHALIVANEATETCRPGEAALNDPNEVLVVGRGAGRWCIDVERLRGRGEAVGPSCMLAPRRLAYCSWPLAGQRDLTALQRDKLLQGLSSTRPTYLTA
jgi:hypothetical protein